MWNEITCTVATLKSWNGWVISPHTFYRACDYLSMLWLKLIHVDKRPSAWYAWKGLIDYLQKYGIFGKHNGNTRIWHTIYNVRKKRFSIECTGVYNFNTSPKISHNFQGIHHYIVNRWKFFVYSKIVLQKHAKLATGCRIAIWALKQHGKKVWLKEPDRVIVIFLTKFCFICINYVYLKNKFLSISVNMICTNETGFRYDTKWRDTALWVTSFCHFVLALKLLSGHRCQILRDARNELLNKQTILIDPSI